MKLLSRIVILGWTAGLLAACSPAAVLQPAATQAPGPAASTQPASTSPTPLASSEPQAVPSPTLEPTLLPAGSAYPALQPNPTGSAYPAQQPNPANLPPAVVAAEKALAKKLNLPVEQILIHAYDQMEWSNGCLGVAPAGEMCLDVITPGYIVMLQVANKLYEIHTDTNGYAVRIMP